MSSMQRQAGEDVLRKIIGPVGMLLRCRLSRPDGAGAHGSNRDSCIPP
jgi:hypothetical protein